MSKQVDHITPPNDSRFWDRVVDGQLNTFNGFKANLKPGAGGNSTAWVNKECKVALELSFGDGTKEIWDVAAGIVESIKTTRNSEFAELTIESISKPMQDVSAERVKDGAIWYRNYPLSIIINELMNKVYKGTTGELPEEKSVASKDLIVQAPEGKLGFWNLGVAPSWDGATFNPEPHPSPITAMVTGLNENEVYVALGGTDDLNPASLWLYNPDRDVWTKIGETNEIVPIQELFYNKNDNLIYGVLWRDHARTNAEMENVDNRVNWFAPPAKIFKWNPFGETEGSRIDDANHSISIGNLFPGQWDIREMYNMTPETFFGRKDNVGGAAVGEPEENRFDNIPNFKLDNRASAGNFTAFKYVSIPFGPLGTAMDVPSNAAGYTGERRRAISRYHPRPKTQGWDEIIPNTQDGGTQWDIQGGSVVGWTNAGNPTLSESAGVLTINPGGDANAGINFQVPDLNNHDTIYRLRIELVNNVEVRVGDNPGEMSNKYTLSRSLTSTNPEEPFSSQAVSNQISNGDFYLGKRDAAQMHISIRAIDANSNAQINNISLTIAKYWDQWHSLEGQAGENLPITNYGKVAIACYVRTRTHPEGEGPGFSLFDPNHETPIFSINGAQSFKFIDQVYLETCLIGQDRRLLNNKTFPAAPPLFGPNEAEDGIQPDNYLRIELMKDKWQDVDGLGTAFNIAKVVNVAPSVDQAKVSSNIQSHVLEQNGFGERVNFESRRAGHGYMSVGIHTIGPRSVWMNSDFIKSGLVKYSNGQQGFFTFSQQADQGKGVILFARPDVTVGLAHRFYWGPTNSLSFAHRFKVKYTAYQCSDNSIHDISGLPVDKSLNTLEPLVKGADAWSPLYPTAGVADDQGGVYVALIESKAVTPLYNGSNEADILNESRIIRIDLKTAAFNPGNVDHTTLYSSINDDSIYPVIGNKVQGKISDEYESESAINNTRKFCWLHFNPNLSDATAQNDGTVMGWCFKRDSILTDPVEAPAIPCHELFALPLSTTNRLVIHDHDIQDGSNLDAMAFLGFVNTEGNFATELYKELEGKPVTWYFRYKKSTINPESWDKVGYGIQLCFLFKDDEGKLQGGNFWDSDAETLSNISVFRNEGFLANRRAVKAILNKGEDIEREAIFTSFDQFLSSFHLSTSAKENAGTSSGLFFKLDMRDTDPRVGLYDFTDLQVWDAISKLSLAHELVFGFDGDTFFLLPQFRSATTHIFEALKGDLYDIEKETSNEIRNVISLQPYKEQLGDIEWEVTHVGGEEIFEDETLFNGEFLLNAATPKKLSINLICTRPGRVAVEDKDYAENERVIPQDATDDIWDRNPVMFKWLTHNPTKEVVVMEEVSPGDVRIYVNTVYINSTTRINPGELLIFVNPDTFEQEGIVIESIDPDLNRINLEHSPGFRVERFTTLMVVDSNIGPENIDGNTITRDWANTFSDQGVAVVTEEPFLNAGGKTVVPVNNINHLRGVKFQEYEEGHKYFPFLMTVYSSNIVATADLPSGFGRSSNPIAWISGVNVSQGQIILNKNYQGAFSIGNVLNFHYVLPPSTDGKEPSPHTSISAPLPAGLGTWNWIVEPTSDKFNIGDVINLKFPGLRLVREDTAIYTVADLISVNRYGEKQWQVPNNRFINHHIVQERARQYLKFYGQPAYNIVATIPFNPELSFVIPGSSLLRKIAIIDPIMFQGFEDFLISGRIRSNTLNVNTLKMNIGFRSDQRL